MMSKSATPPKSPDPDTVRRLAFLRGLLLTADKQSRLRSPMASAAILTFQDAAEGMLILVAEKLGAELRNVPPFDAYWEPIAAKVGRELLSHKVGMTRLNRARVNLKHHGVRPDNSELEGFRSAVTNFLSDAAESAFGVDFMRVTLVDLLPEGSIRLLLIDAQLALADARGSDLLASTAKAFEQLMFDTTPIDRHGHRVSIGQRAPALNMTRIGEGDPALAAVWGKLVQHVDQIGAATDMISRGINFAEYLRFQGLTPHVFRAAGGGQRLISSADAPQPSADDLVFCFDFVLDSATRMLRLS